jgi:hypothetical protein
MYQVKNKAVNLHFIAKREKNVVRLIDRSFLVRKSSRSVLRHLTERSQNSITHVATCKSMLTRLFFDRWPKGHKTLSHMWQQPTRKPTFESALLNPAAKINICLKVLHLENMLTIRLYTAFRWRDFPDNSYLTRTTHSLQKVANLDLIGK